MRVISGKARGTILNSVESITTRPTLDRVKENVFNIIRGNIDENSVILDLFAGSGAIGIEFLSRGAKKAYFVDKDKNCVIQINKNLEKTHLKDKAEVINSDYSSFLNNRLREKIDIVYLDPPYKEKFLKEVIEIILKCDILSKNGIIIVETDEEERDLQSLDEIKNNLERENKRFSLEIYDRRKYGRVHLLFLRKEED